MIPLGRAMLATAARLVPPDERSEWLAEWSAELWYLRHSEDHPCGPLRFCAGAFRDAPLLRLHRPAPRLRLLGDPIRCLLVLAMFAGAAFLVAMGSPQVKELIGRRPLAAHALIQALSLAVLPVAAGVSVTAQRLRGWLLLAAKIALITPAVFFGIFDLAPLIGAVQPHATLIGYILAYRWALNDQRRRCPDCLRLCGNPVPIGHPSYVLLHWYGTELICPQGHGLLQVPQLPKASFSSHRWLRLDASWRSLFS